MTDERALLSPELEKVVKQTKKDGIVLVRHDRSLLAGPYKWQAALCHLIQDHAGKDADGNDKPRWCSMECFARFSDGTAHGSHVDKARGRVTALKNELLKQGEFLLLDYAGPNKAKSAMCLVRGDEDVELAQQQIDVMVQRRDTTVERAAQGMAILNAKRHLRQSLEGEH